MSKRKSTIGKRLTAIAAAAAVTLTWFAFCAITPIPADANTETPQMPEGYDIKVLADFESGLNGFTADGAGYASYGSAAPALTRETAQTGLPLLGAGSLKVSQSLSSTEWPQKNASVTGSAAFTGVNGYDGFMLRLATNNMALKGGYLAVTMTDKSGEKHRLGKNAYGITRNGEVLGFGFDDYLCMPLVPAGFDGYVVMPFSGGAPSGGILEANGETPQPITAETDLTSCSVRLDFLSIAPADNDTFGTWATSDTYIDDISLYKGTNYDTLKNLLVPAASIVTLADFDTGDNGFTADGAGYGFNAGTGAANYGPAAPAVARETGWPLHGAGSLKISQSLGAWPQKNASVTGSAAFDGAKGYDGVLLRLATNNTAKNGGHLSITLTDKNGVKHQLGRNAYGITLGGEVLHFAIDDYLWTPLVPAGFDGYVVMPFVGGTPSGGITSSENAHPVTAETDFTSCSVRLDFLSIADDGIFGTWGVSDTYVDDISLYKGGNLKALIPQLNDPPQVLSVADFETGDNGFAVDHVPYLNGHAAQKADKADSAGARDTAAPLTGAGSYKVTYATPIDNASVSVTGTALTGAAGYQGLAFRFKTGPNDGGLPDGAYKKLIAVTVADKDGKKSMLREKAFGVSLDGTVTPLANDLYWGYVEIPHDFDGCLFFPFAGMTAASAGDGWPVTADMVNPITAETDFSQMDVYIDFISHGQMNGWDDVASNQYWSAGASYIDNMALYKGLVGNAMYDALGGGINYATELLFDFEDGVQTFDRGPADANAWPNAGSAPAGSSTQTHETARPLHGTGSLSIQISPDAQGEAFQWKSWDIFNQTAVSAASGYSGLMFRVKSDAPSTAFSLYMCIPGATVLGKDAVYMDLSGKTMPLTLDGNGSNHMMGGTDGYIFLPFSGYSTADWAAPIYPTTDLSNLKVMVSLFDQTWAGTTTVIDDIALYKGDDLKLAAEQLGAVFTDYLKPIVLADFESGMDTYEEDNAWFGEWGGGPGYSTTTHETENPLIGTGSLKASVEGYGWLTNAVSRNTQLLTGGAAGYDGIAIRLKTDMPKPAMINWIFSTGDIWPNGYSYMGKNAKLLKSNGTLLDMSQAYIEGAGGNHTEGVIPARFDGWVFLPFEDGVYDFEWNNPINPYADFSRIELILSLFQEGSTQSVWSGYNAWFDNIALYDGTDYYAITKDLGDEVSKPNYGDALATKLYLDGIEYADFDENTFEYDIPVAGEYSPAITVETLNPDAAVVVNNSGRGLPTEAEVVVTTPQGEVSYTLRFTQTTGGISTIELPEKLLTPQGTGFHALNLPHSLAATLADGTKTGVDITWLEGDYNGNAPGVYEVRGLINATLWAANPNELYATMYIEVTNPQKEFYVSASAAPGGDGSLNAPFNTMEQARAAVRPLAAAMTGDIIVYIMDGTYYQEDTFTLGAADSGTNGYSVIYRAYEGAKPVISGGKRITGWTLHDPSLGIWKAAVPADFDTRTLFVNGARATRAHGDTNHGIVTNPETQKYVLPESGLYADMASWRNPQDIQLVWRHTTWQHSFYNVQRIDGRNITTQLDTFSANDLGSRNVQVTYVENAYELMALPGDWYLDKTAHELYYIPRNGEDLATAEVIAGALDKIVSAEGTSSAPVSNVAFDGLTFSHSSFSPANAGGGYDDWQTNIGQNYYITGAVHFTGSRNITVENCAFTHIGAAGLMFELGSQNAVVVNNTFSDISANGISIGGVTSEDHHPARSKDVTQGFTIQYNTLTTVGAEYGDSAAIFLGYTRDCTIVHNTMYDLPYSGICSGWGWGWMHEPESQAVCGKNRIEYNLIYDYMNVQFDGGGVYTMGYQPGTVIAYNYMYGQRTASAYIYPDCGSAYMLIHHNVIDGTTRNDTGWFKTWYLPNTVQTGLLNSNNLTCVNNYITDNLEKYNESGSGGYVEGENNISEPQFRISNKQWPRMARNVMKYAGANPPFNEPPLVDKTTAISVEAVGRPLADGVYLGVDVLDGVVNASKALAFGDKAKIVGEYDLYFTLPDGIQEITQRAALSVFFPAVKGVKGTDLIVCRVLANGSLEQIDSISADDSGVSILASSLERYVLVTLSDIPANNGSTSTTVPGNTGGDSNGGSDKPGQVNTGYALPITAVLTLAAGLTGAGLTVKRRKKTGNA